MLFNSLEFLIFLPVVVILYYLLPLRFRWFFLLVASYFFYLHWKAEYLFLILTTTLVSYFTAIKIDDETRIDRRRGFLLLNLFVNLGLLFIFKYFNFFNANLHSLLSMAGVTNPLPDMKWLLPLGISFYTLQVLGYTLDVYHGRLKAERKLGIFSLFVAFFPQLAAGPIERGRNMLPQFAQRHTFDYERIVNGLLRIGWGFFKKLVIADRLALLVNMVYDHPTRYTGSPLIFATYAFAFQIYCDFSAYSDIAIGAARIFGFNLMENFHQPYYSKSIPEFWRNWHISLSTWLRDYIFYPLRRSILKGNGGGSGLVIALVLPPMLTMLLSGLWHGANWTFVVWGGLLGTLIVLDVIWNQAVKPKFGFVKLPRLILSIIQVFITFNLVCFTWIFFRANSLSDALYILRNLFINLKLQATGITFLMPGGKYELFIVLCAIVLMEVVHWLQLRQVHIRGLALRLPCWVRWAAYYILILLILVFGQFGQVEFIYVQF